MTNLELVEQFTQEFIGWEKVSQAEADIFLNNLIQACGGDRDEALKHYTEALLLRSQPKTESETENGAAAEPTSSKQDEGDGQQPANAADEVEIIPQSVTAEAIYVDLEVQFRLQKAWDNDDPSVLKGLPLLISERFFPHEANRSFRESAAVIQRFVDEQIKRRKGDAQRAANLRSKAFRRTAYEQAAKDTEKVTGNTPSQIGILFGAAAFIALWGLFSVVLHTIHDTQTVQVAAGPNGVVPLQVISSQNPWLDSISQAAVMALCLTVLLFVIPLIFSWINSFVKKEVNS